jgi:hypothetical protein
MYTPTTAWDRAPTDKELESFYGKDIERNAHDEYLETLTKDVRKISVSSLSLDYVRTVHDKTHDVYKTVIAKYSAAEAIEDYLGYDKPLAALFEVIEKSDCPHVAALRLAIAEEFSRHNAEELDIARSEA